MPSKHLDEKDRPKTKAHSPKKTPKKKVKSSKRNGEDKKKDKKRRERSVDIEVKSGEKEGKKRASKKNVDLPKRTIPMNSAIETATDCYFVLNKLGSGGFGDVYEVMRRSDKMIFAVKVEYVKTSPDRRLKKEYEIYREITKQKTRGNLNAEHLMEVVDYGECPELVHFMFMPLCGQSLDSILKKKTPPFATALILAEQSLRAVQNFHAFMHIHRDLKPANFVLGKPPNQDKIYLIDFGMAVRYCVDPKKMPKTSVYDFIGTLRYASRTTHQGMPQTRKDDLESWFFVALEFFKRRILPWTHEKDTKAVELQKDKMFIELPDSVFGVLPPCFLTIANAINDIKMFDAPDYDFIHEAFYKLAEEKGISLDGPLDLGEGPQAKTPTTPRKLPSTTPTMSPGISTPPPMLHIIEARTEDGKTMATEEEDISRKIVITPPKPPMTADQVFGARSKRKSVSHSISQSITERCDQKSANNH